MRLHPAAWTDSPLIVYDPETGATNVLPVEVAEDRHFRFAFSSIPGGFLTAGPLLGPTDNPTNVVFRFHSDGTRDTNFLSPALSLFPQQILPEPGGAILVTGYAGLYNVVRLNANGSINRSYQLEFNPDSAFLIPTNRLLYRSNFGVSCLDFATGRAPGSFTRVTTDSAIEDMVVAGNYFYICGAFTNVGGASRPYLARLTLNGQLDPTYLPVFNGPAKAILVDSKNRLLVFGLFTKVNGISRVSAARLNPDGSLDMTFEPDVFLHVPDKGFILFTKSIAELPNGDIFALPYAGGSDRGVIITSDLPLRANLASKSDDGFELRLTTLPQKTYLLETSADLANWQPLLTTNAAAYQLSVQIPAGQSHLFLRAKNSN